MYNIINACVIIREERILQGVYNLNFEMNEEDIETEEEGVSEEEVDVEEKVIREENDEGSDSFKEEVDVEEKVREEQNDKGADSFEEDERDMEEESAEGEEWE